jgi:hypothetical protein
MSRREPFLVNPHIGILNPKTKRGKRMAKKWGKGHMAWVRSFQRKRRKSNPWPVAGMVSANPRHRRSRKAHNPKRRKRNPSEAPSMSLMGVSVPSVNTLLYTGGGFIAPPFIENAVRPLVSGFLPGGTAGRYILKTGAVILTSVGARFFGGRSAGKQAALGGAIYILASVWTDFVAPYFSGASLAPASVSSYVTGGTPRSMRSYVPGRNTMGMPSAAVGGGNSGAIGGTADRFKRF